MEKNCGNCENNKYAYCVKCVAPRGQTNKLPYWQPKEQPKEIKRCVASQNTRMNCKITVCDGCNYFRKVDCNKCSDTLRNIGHYCENCKADNYIHFEMILQQPKESAELSPDVEKMAEIQYQKEIGETKEGIIYRDGKRKGFIDGYKKASEELFTKEQMIDFARFLGVKCDENYAYYNKKVDKWLGAETFNFTTEQILNWFLKP